MEPAHLLLAIADNPECVGAQVLIEMGISLEALSGAVQSRMPPRTGLLSAPMALSSSAQRVIDLCYEEARRLDDKFVGTEHLLLGIVRLDDGPAGGALRQYNVSLALVRAAVANRHESEALLAASPPPTPLLARIAEFIRRFWH